jgi:hypothetical protein
MDGSIDCVLLCNLWAIVRVRLSFATGRMPGTLLSSLPVGLLVMLTLRTYDRGLGT